uniref:Uncharacterized protein n=1 Tax=Aegilops tauschii subsp. strangulata TaxID=200361 RepID=A0A453L9D3_AEGTS
SVQPAPRTVSLPVSKRRGSSSRATSAKRVGFHLVVSNPGRRRRSLPPPASAPIPPPFPPHTRPTRVICRPPLPPATSAELLRQQVAAAGPVHPVSPPPDPSTPVPRLGAVQPVLGLQLASAQV